MTWFNLGTSVKLYEPEILVDDALDTVIEPLLPLWTTPASHDASVRDCKLAVTTSAGTPPPMGGGNGADTTS